MKGIEESRGPTPETPATNCPLKNGFAAPEASWKFMKHIFRNWINEITHTHFSTNNHKPWRQGCRPHKGKYSTGLITNPPLHALKCIEPAKTRHLDIKFKSSIFKFWANPSIYCHSILLTPPVNSFFSVLNQNTHLPIVSWTKPFLLTQSQKHNLQNTIKFKHIFVHNYTPILSIQ